ncbi:MAG TPA: glycosyltransferase [Actinocrinis sp.]|uniref:glycosyltransferase n=1 Tax=Actinocrinis sp. TaxID=1920516 RepID=UPI002DDD93DD|nr:glycosyltransferase [Actinocrinis sp.]HEV3173841.1 glycosyltransferase [Actinocrinis sp.]
MATFSQALFQDLTSSAEGSGVVRVLGPSELGRDSGDAVVGHLRADSRLSMLSAAAELNRFDVVIVQHEYGVYGGRDGEQVLDVLARLRVPSIVVLHTVLTSPTPHQRSILERIADSADAVVVMSRTAAARLFDGYLVESSKIVVIAHGAHRPAVTAPLPQTFATPPAPLILSWGLLGPGKGLEWAIDSLAHLRDLVPVPRYLIAGQTHPKVLERDGEAYRESLKQRATARGVATMVDFDPEYRDAPALLRLVRSADVVVMPYDSSEQTTSGVLIEAVAALRPVVATRFPHARELLTPGGGLLVDHRDPVGIAAALRRVLTEPGLAARMSASAARIAPGLAWTAVAERYRAVAGDLLAERAETVETGVPA